MAGGIPKIVVIGPAYVDMAIKCHDFPRPGQTVDGAGFSYSPTGPGPNRAVAAALCNCDVHLISKIGDDLFGKLLLTALKKHKVNTEYLYTAQAINTGVTVTMVDSLGENESCVSPGANRALCPDELACAEVEQIIAAADLCLIHGQLPTETIVAAIRVAQLNKTRTILDIEMPITDETQIENLDWPMEYYAVNVLIPELKNSPITADVRAGNIYRLKHIGSELIAKGIQAVIMKTGHKGTLIFDRKGTTTVPGFDLETVDHNACDDAFAGALAASCGSGDELAQAVKFASAAGSLACAKFGSQDSLPKKQDIIELLLKQAD